MADPREMDELESAASELVYQTIQNAAMGTERTKQQYEEYRLGVSNLGHCRQYAKLLIEQTPFTDERDKTAAWVGTVLGDAIENQLAVEHPEWLFQHEVVFPIPSGGEVNAHPDIVVPASAATEEHPQGVRDLKSKAELETVKRYGQTQQQRFQLHAYAAALIEEGILDPEKPIWLADIFFDRSAKGGLDGFVAKPYVIGEWYDPSVVMQIDQWVEDVKYAVMQGQDASRDMPREWCAAWCEFYRACRGEDTDAEGLITDPEVVAAVETYREASALESQAKRMKNSAQIVLNRVEGGSTGDFTIRWVEVGPADVSYRRNAYRKLSITPITKKVKN